MKELFLEDNEAERLKVLDSYKVLDSLPENGFDDITKLASQICETPISLISLIDKDRQWFKSRYGIDVHETQKDHAFCTHAILNPDEVMMVPDSLKDDRFKNNPLATGAPHVVFYAGVPLVNPEGYPLGTLCVIGHEPKQLTPNQVEALKVLAKQVMNQLELRKKVNELKETATNLQESYQYLERFAVMASHDIKTPLTSIILSAQMLKARYGDLVDDKANHMLDTINHSSKKLLDYLNQMLDYSKSNTVLTKRKQEVFLTDLIQHIIKLLNIPASIRFEFHERNVYLKTSRIALEQIFINLINNAVKYSDKENGLIKLEFLEEKQFYRFKLTDNGKGIAPKEIDTVFISKMLISDEDKMQDRNAKIGLSTVKNLVESLGGEIKVNSVLNEGTTFEFTLRK
ncbi:GAF domain-containing sensor histidine kinase [Mucilaginibacter arboris]|uniref:histidine kinase n=1 Tax=Mucilaginibacter arboris TaxID=2682090 RepID=A0A7K1SUK8_9SPHI|nr:GAF domain-containing sensor histidine kinase [Mucilaginibacter arboris]MVN20953.1 GAF domain-containing protein [Mucilaginibacter arboris]